MSVRYLQASNQAELQYQIKDWIDAGSTDDTYLLLLDGAILGLNGYSMEKTQYISASLSHLYADTDFETMSEYGVQTIYFNGKKGKSEEFSELLSFYLCISNSKPTFSIVKLNNSFNIDFWLWLLDLRIENDTQPYINRFADTHMFPNLYQILTVEQKTYIARYIKEWGIKDRNGNWQVFTFEEDQLDLTDVNLVLTLTEQQLDHLFLMSEADRIYADLAKQKKLKTYFQIVSEQYSHIRFLLDKAREKRIEDYGEKLYFVEFFIGYNPDVFEQHVVKQLLFSIGSSADIVKLTQCLAD